MPLKTVYLGIAKVQDLIQKLIDEHKIALQALLAELAAEIRFENIHCLQAQFPSLFLKCGIMAEH